MSGADVTSCDVAVVGAGPAGIAAATSAAECGARVLVIDEALRAGGQIWRHNVRRDLPALARKWLDRFDRAGAELWSGATVVDATPDRRLLVERAGAARVVRADALVLANGARELFLPFPRWTLPGVVGVGGAQALLKAGARLRGRRAVIAGSGPLLLPVAALLARAGVDIAIVAEQASAARVARFAAGRWREPGKLLQAARYRAAFRSVRYVTGAWVEAADGDDVVAGALLTDGRRRWVEPCDLLCVGYGLVPATELARLLGCVIEHGAVRTGRWQQTSVPGVWCAGEPTGIAGAAAALLEGRIAGCAAAGAPERGTTLFAARDRERTFAAALTAGFALRDELRALPDPQTIVCRCEDVPFGRLRRAPSLRAAKLRTRAGMGPCQGRVCAPALAFLMGWEPDVVQPPSAPARVATLLDSADED